MAQGLHHHPHKRISLFDHFMYLVSFLAPVMTFPQFYDIWTKKQASSVSLTTWGAYAISSLLWLIYWREHKEKLIFISQALIVLLDFGIFLGIILYK